MELNPNSQTSWIQSLSDEEIERLKTELTDNEAAALFYEWSRWARPYQLPPVADWIGWLVLAGRGGGKALALNTPLVTPSGWTTMGAVQVGDTLFDELGTPCRVLAVHPAQLGRPCYRVKFSDGAEVVADAEHLWTTIDRRARKALGRAKKPQSGPRTVTTEYIASTVYDGREVNHAIPLSAPIGCPERDFPMDPYLLGCWLGDGTSKAAEITTADQGIVEAFTRAGWLMVLRRTQNSGAAMTWIIRSRLDALAHDGTTGRLVATGEGFQTKLRLLGVWKNKHIPPMYLRGSKAQRLSLLQGLMDTDGYVGPNGNAEFCTTKQCLADAVFELCTSLGIKSVISTGRAMLKGRDCGPKYRVSFTAYEPVVRLPRKLANIGKRGSQARRQARRYIVAVDEVPSVPVRCITVDSPSKLYLCGRAMIPTHNTRQGAEFVRAEVEAGRAKRIGLIGETSADGRGVMITGESGILSVCPPWDRPEFIAQSSQTGRPQLQWKSGAVATLYDAREPDQLRGPQHDLIWFDELAKYRYAQGVYDMAMMGLRLGTNPRWLATTTPRPIPLILKLVKDSHVVTTRYSSRDNLINLAASFRANVIERYEGTRLGRQELDAEILEDVPGALWTRRALDDYRRDPDKVPHLERIVVAVDPAATSGEEANETGIIVAGTGSVDNHQHGFVLDDWSCHGSPDEWGRRTVAAYRLHKADRIVAEKNQGGEMVEHVIKSVDRNVSVTLVTASRGKVARAEPVSALYEQGRVHHVGTFADLEDQMVAFTPQNAMAKAEGKSPDRVDALVWALSELFLNITSAARNPAKPPPSHTNSAYSPTRNWIRPGPTRANMR